VGFHADPSDVKISTELIDLLDDIELVITCRLIHSCLAEHEDAYVISLTNGNIGKPPRVVHGFSIWCGYYKKKFNIDAPIKTLILRKLNETKRIDTISMASAESACYLN